MEVIGFLIREPKTRGPAVFSFMARIPAGALALLLPLLALSDHMSPTVAGASLALCRLGQAVSGPVWGRLVDRTSLRLALGIGGAAVSVVAMGLSAIRFAPWSLLMMAVLLGSVLLPMNALMRSLWNRSLVSDADKMSAAAFESGMNEGVLLSARLVVAASTVVFSVHEVIAVQVLVTAVGMGGLATCPIVRTSVRPAAVASDFEPAVPWRDTLGLFVTYFLFASSLGAFGLTLILAAGGDHAPDAALAVAVWGAGSLVGLLLWGSRRGARAPRPAHSLPLLVLMGTFQGTAALAGYWSPLGLMVAGFMAGLPIAAIVTGLFTKLGHFTPQGRQSEIFAWTTTMILAGDACGTFVAGTVFDQTATVCAAGGVAVGSALLAASISATGLRQRFHRIGK